MAEVIVLIVFFLLVVVGSGTAALLGRVPTATELAEQDEVRWARYKRALER